MAALVGEAVVPGVAADGAAEAAGDVVAGTFARGALEHAPSSSAVPVAKKKRSRFAFDTGTIDNAREGHGDAWSRQGRRTDRCEPRNAVPPR